jgi:hypothetical protein
MMASSSTAPTRLPQPASGAPAHGLGAAAGGACHPPGGCGPV